MWIAPVLALKLPTSKKVSGRRRPDADVALRGDGYHRPRRKVVKPPPARNLEFVAVGHIQPKIPHAGCRLPKGNHWAVGCLVRRIDK